LIFPISSLFPSQALADCRGIGRASLPRQCHTDPYGDNQQYMVLVYTVKSPIWQCTLFANRPPPQTTAPGQLPGRMLLSADLEGSQPGPSRQLSFRDILTCGEIPKKMRACRWRADASMRADKSAAEEGRVTPKGAASSEVSHGNSRWASDCKT
jgi:hypothetical protein